MRKNQSHSEESRARIAESLHAAREAGRWKSPGGPLWTAHEDSLLGTMPDKQVAAATGRSLGSIYARRSKLGIPSMRPPGTPQSNRMTNATTKAFRGIDASANRGMEMPTDGIHFTLDRSYAATYGEVVEAEITMGRNLNLMAIESAADFITRFAAVGISAGAFVGEFIDGSATVADIASDWESFGAENLMGEDFTNFLGRHVRHAVDTITFPENAVEEDPAIIVLNLENISK